MSPDAVDSLIEVLVARGYTVVGPTVRDHAIVLDEIHARDDLPVGWGDQQEAGTYRLVRRGDGALFGYSVPAGSLRRFLQSPSRRLWSATRREGRLDLEEEPPPLVPFAFLGARPCDIAAVGVQDRVLRDGRYAEPTYAARREASFVVAVNCGEPAATCFCASTGTGPGVGAEGYDLVLTEILDDGRHRLVVDIGSDRGRDLLDAVPSTAATDDDVAAARRVVAGSAERMHRTLDPLEARDVLRTNLEHARWDDVAARCLSCANCTLVCPTCFCHTVDDVNSLDGQRAERVERWDSCFALEHSFVHGAGAVHADIRSRYRQWLTHKLSTWWDQFGVSGCVGCGRCITWCPVGIDLTEEVAAMANREEEP